MARDLGYLPPKKYEVWSKMAVEVGRMVGGWIKADRAKLNIPEKGDGEEKQNQNETVYECSGCGEKITEKIKQYSEKQIGRAHV